MADCNSTQYGKMVGAAGVQDLLTPFEAVGRLRTAFFSLTTPASGMPTSSEFAYLSKLPKGARVLGALLASEAGLQASSTAVVEVETGEGTYSNASGSLDVATGFAYTLDWTAATVATQPLTVGGLGRVRLNPGANTVASKYFKGCIFYVID